MIPKKKFPISCFFTLTFTLWSIESYSTGQALSPQGRGRRGKWQMSWLDSRTAENRVLREGVALER